jgi:hypothetical protein
MHTRCNFNIYGTEGESYEHEGTLDMDLSIGKLFRFKSTSPHQQKIEFALCETGIQRSVFDVVANDVVPRIVGDIHEVCSNLVGSLDVGFECEFRNSSDVKVGDDKRMMSVDSKMNIRFSTRTNVAMTLDQALCVSKSSLEKAITFVISESLRKVIYGETGSGAN